VKLVVAIMHGDDATGCIEVLADRGFPTTRLDSRGGFLQKGNTTLLCGVSSSQVEDVVSILRHHSKSRTELLSPLPPVVEPGDMYVPYPVEVEVGGAVVFVLEVERFEKI
jgi:uncharacterized protein YaaQ